MSSAYSHPIAVVCCASAPSWRGSPAAHRARAHDRPGGLESLLWGRRARLPPRESSHRRKSLPLAKSSMACAAGKWVAALLAGPISARHDVGIRVNQHAFRPSSYGRVVRTGSAMQEPGGADLDARAFQWTNVRRSASSRVSMHFESHA